MSKPESQLADYYDEAFYKSQIEGSYKSAVKYANYLAHIFKPLSVVDVGCGRGAWLKAFKDSGAKIVAGFDGNWNNQNNMIDRSIVFHSADLNNLKASGKDRYDLAISLEVAEHLEASSANSFVEFLCKSSDVVMFGAAYTKQGGTNHINEQPPTYWAQIFIRLGYIPYDLFRPFFWGDRDIEFWYQQNTFLYVNRNSKLNQKLSDSGYQPMMNIAFMDCVHPILYGSKLAQTAVEPGFRQLIRRTIPEPLLGLARKIKGALS